MTEQEATDELEILCGGRNRAFRLMRIYQSAGRTGSDVDRRTGHVDIDAIFRASARNRGYSEAAITHYLECIR